MYPKKKNEHSARRIWEDKNLDTMFEEIIDFVEKAKDTSRWKRGFIKNIDRFLEEGSWKDDIKTYDDKQKNGGIDLNILKI